MAEYNATVAQRVEVAPGLIILRVVPDKLPFEFKPGQYVVLGLKASEKRIDEAEGEAAVLPAGTLEAAPLPPGELSEGAVAAVEAGGGVAVATRPVTTPEGEAAVAAQANAIVRAQADPERMIRRAYSIASASRSDEFLEFYLTVVMSGELSPRLFNLKLKDRLFVGPKAVGVFTLDKVERSKNVLMIATGTGLAPYMSMIRTNLECLGDRKFVVVHGARYSWDLGYRAELTVLARHCPGLTYIPVITRPKDDVTWQGRSGYLQSIITSQVVEEECGLDLTPDNFHVFLCGNPGMIETVISLLTERGFVRDKGHDIGTLHTEEYW